MTAPNITHLLAAMSSAQAASAFSPRPLPPLRRPRRLRMKAPICAIRGRNIRVLPSSDSPSLGRVWPEKWIRGPITARRAIVAPAGLPGARRS